MFNVFYSEMFNIVVKGNKVNRRISDDTLVPKLSRFIGEYHKYVLKWSI